MENGFETYEALRAFADSWGLLFMTVVFCIAVAMALWPGRRKSLEDQANIPFRHEDAPAAAPRPDSQEKER